MNAVASTRASDARPLAGTSDTAGFDLSALADDAEVSTTNPNAVDGSSTSRPGELVANAAGAVANVLKPQAYVVAAAYTLGVKVGPFEAGTKVLIAALPPAASVESGDLAGAVGKATFFISITLPGSRTPIVGTYNAARQSVEWGKGKVQPTFNGNVVFFENARGGLTGSTGSVQGSGNAGVILKVPGSEALSGALSGLVSGGTRMIEAGELASTMGGATPGVAAEEAVRKIVADSLSTGKYYVGAAYRADVSTNGDTVTVTGPGGVKKSFSPGQLINESLKQFTSDTRNFGIPEVAAGKGRLLVSKGVSYEQLSPVSGGNSHGDPALAAMNTINAWGRKAGVLASRTGPVDTSDPSRIRYVKLWSSVRSGDEATAVVARLKSTLDPAAWSAFVSELKPSTDRLGIDFGQPAFAGGRPRNEDDAQSAAWLMRDFHKDSHPQEVREIVEQRYPRGQMHPVP